MSFLFGRLGNKKNDIKYFKQYLPFDNIKTVIEPFGGTFSVIRYCYNDDKYIKIVNDTDKYINAIYNNPERYDEIKKYMNNIALENLDEKGYVIFKDFIKKFENNDIFNTELDKTLIEYWKIDNTTRGRFIKALKTINNTENINLMKKIKFCNVDYLEIINQYKYDENTFIFLDPPYMFNNNSQYTSQVCETDMTDILIRIKEIFENPDTKAKIMLIINDLKIIRWLFNNYVKGEYKKIYQLSKKNTNPFNYL